MLTKVYHSLQERGFQGTLAEISLRLNRKIRFSVDRRFDRRFGVDTTGKIGLAKLDIPVAKRPTGFHYEPTPVSAFRFLIEALDIDYSRYTFIDFGSGKGRALFLASEYPFKRILGVEFARPLHETPLANFKVWKSPKQKCFHLESVCMDARDFRLPDGPLVLFFFTPFTRVVTDWVVDNILDSMLRSVRPIRVVYYGGSDEFVECLERLKLPRREIYRCRPFTAMKRYRGFLYG
jgi:SAM-dependent methyltransferase